MHWKIKGVTQKALAAVPGGVSVNDLLQRLLGGLRNFGKNVDTKVEDWRILASHTQELAIPIQGFRFLEIGTGWFPTLPICYSLAGASQIVTYDLTRHLSSRLTTRMLQRLTQHLPTIAQASARPSHLVESEFAELKQATDIPDLLRRARIDYRAPADATVTGLSAASIDVVFSNSVLEHVPPGVIQKMFDEAQRVLRPGGLMIHSVNCGDHYAYFDKKITFINYLTYPEDQWRFWDNQLLYQNRLRPSDFIKMAEQAGFRIVLRKQKPRPALLELLPTLNIAPEFRGYSPEELCTTSIDFVAQKPA